MSADDNHLQLRIAVASIVALVGAAMISRLPQLLPEQATVPWYQSPFMITGIVIVIVALLILIVPPKYWRHMWQSALKFPRWPGEMYFWKCHGPRYSILKPIVRSKRTDGGIDYIADIQVIVQNRDKYPMTVELSSTMVFLEQKWEPWPKQPVQLLTHSGIPRREVKPREKLPCQVVVSTRCIGDPDAWPDLQSRYRWGIRGIYVTLRGRYTKELHKGIYPTRGREYRTF